MDGPALEAFVRRRIGDARELAGYSKREMARRMEMPASTWQDIEMGERPLTVALLAQVADVVGLSFAWFLPGEMVAPDLSAAILGRYPLMASGDVRWLVRVAELVYADHLRGLGALDLDRGVE